MRTLPFSPPEAAESGTVERDESAASGWPKLLVAGLFVLVFAVGLWIRLRNNGYGLPYVYNYDEATHFTSRAVNMFGGSFDPRYYQNPSGFTYLVYAALRLVYATLPFNLEFGTISQQFRTDPTPIWELARTLTALIAMAGVVATFFVARRFWGARVALIAMAVLAFSFLSVTYSRIAVTDVGTFLPVALAVWGILRVLDDGRLRWYLLSGAAIGLAVGFKYTCGLLLLPLLIAAAVRWWHNREVTWWKRDDLRFLVLAGVAMVIVFAITTPFFFVHPKEALYELRQQATAAGDIAKLGQSQQGGISYYLESFTWGFGWGAIAFAALGAFFELRRNLLRGIVLISFPVALFLYMGTQTRYFGRWLLMIYPILAMLAGVGVVRSVELLLGRSRGLSPTRRWALSGAAAGVIAALLAIQPLAADVRTSNVLGRDDTRQIARDWLVRNYPDSLRIIIEPAVPDSFYRKLGKLNPLKSQFVRGFTNDLRRQGALDAPDGQNTTYAATLSPQNIDTYRSTGFCLVMTTSLIRGRAENAKVPEALAYYKRLERESRRVFHVSPYKPGRGPVPLHYDFSYDYYPTAYERPGGEVDIYRLNDCKQGRKRVPQRPYGSVGLEKGVGTSLPPN